MRLLTHNMLKCNRKDVETGYPLKIEPETVEMEVAEYDRGMVTSMLKKIDLNGLKVACACLNMSDGIDSITEANIADLIAGNDSALSDEVLAIAHRVLFEVRVVAGQLVCPDSGRKFPIKDGIPNMLLHEDEI